MPCHKANVRSTGLLNHINSFPFSFGVHPCSFVLRCLISLKPILRFWYIQFGISHSHCRTHYLFTTCRINGFMTTMMMVILRIQYISPMAKYGVVVQPVCLYSPHPHVPRMRRTKSTKHEKRKANLNRT